MQCGSKTGDHVQSRRSAMTTAMHKWSRSGTEESQSGHNRHLKPLPYRCRWNGLSTCFMGDIPGAIQFDRAKQQLGTNVHDRALARKESSI